MNYVSQLLRRVCKVIRALVLMLLPEDDMQRERGRDLSQ